MSAPSATPPQFSIVTGPASNLADFLRKNPYAAARAFAEGAVTIEGDPVEAIRFYLRQPHSKMAHRLVNAAARLLHTRVLSPLLKLRGASRDIQFHYDQSNEFYAQFLDRNMVYSCAYFRSPQDSLEQAQEAKLDLICRKLRLGEGDRLLDIGCGWGGLLQHAARFYRASGAGCTLSHAQASWARESIAANGFAERLTVRECDYRDVHERFSKIASVGMFEHVGPAGLATYFRAVRAMLEPGGLFLNHGVVRPEGVSPAAETLFVARYVFPGLGLMTLSDVIAEAGKAGFEVLDVENLRPHYALTCREWVRRLQRNERRCVELVGGRIYRTWLLYLAAFVINFEDGYSAVHQVLLTPRGEPGRTWLARGV